MIFEALAEPPDPQGLKQFAELGLAFVLSTLIGLEREIRQKSAGLRTHTLVGVGAALFTEVSKYGFNDFLGVESASVDPSRVAAQIVTGIGFIGGGLIFVRRDAVRGLTTAAIVWLTCAVGMACGAGLPLLAIAATGMHFVVVSGYTPVIRRMGTAGPELWQLRLTYRSGQAVLPRVLERCTSRGFTVTDVTVDRGAALEEPGRDDRRGREFEPVGEAIRRVTSVVLQIHGTGIVHDLVADLSEIDGVLSVGAGEAVEPSD